MERPNVMNAALLGRCVFSGVLATLTMDLGAALVRKTGLTAGVSPRLLGRWLESLAQGKFAHDNIEHSQALPGELPFAIAGHYLIGLTLTLAFCALLSLLPSPPSAAAAFALALGFGLLTNALPWLWMYPTMGFGAFGKAGPPELMLFRTSVVNHLFFGLGLALFTRALGAVGLQP